MTRRWVSWSVKRAGHHGNYATTSRHPDGRIGPLLLVRPGLMAVHGLGCLWFVGSEGVLAVLVRFGVHANSENAALSPPDVGDAVPAQAVEGRALSGA